MLGASKTRFFACLLALLAGRPSFYLVVNLVGLIVGLAIGKAKSMSKEVAISFFVCFL